MPGTLYVVATPIGNLEDITARALRVLREVAVIAAEDTRRTAHLLARYAITTPTTSLHEHNEKKKTPALIERLTHGEDIAIVSDAGTPVISDPGRLLVQAAVAASIKVEPIPGPSAVMAALAVAGLSTDRFSFLSFPPIRSRDRTEWFESLAELNHTAVFFEAPHRLKTTLEQLLHIAGNRNIVLCREMTKIYEELVRGPIKTVLGSLKANDRVKGEVTVVVEIGQTTDNASAEKPDDTELANQFGQITDISGISRRSALATLARKHQMSPNDVYEAIERAKKFAK